jgi:hypothetical protein
MREFVIDLTDITNIDGFLAAFNAGFCHHVGGKLHSLNWDTFNDYLGWPEEKQYRLVFRNWRRIRGVHRRIVKEILRDNPQVEVAFR